MTRLRVGPREWVACAAFVIAFVAGAPAAQAAPFGIVRVTIDKVSAIDCFEGTIPFTDECTGAADFYPIVTIDGNEQSLAPIDNRNNADPDPDWFFDQTVDIAKGRVPVSIEIRDQDGEFRLGDDHADIDPTNGGHTSNLDFGANLAPCTLSGDTTAACDRFTSTSGTGPSRKARIFYKVQVFDVDSDGDSLPNSWEFRGLDTDGDGTPDVDLAAMGADQSRQDIFVELDCFVATGHSHCPLAGAIQDVVQAFANAPRANQDLTTGVQLHVDTGTLYGAGAVTQVNGTGGVRGTYGDIGAAAGARAAGRGGDQITETAANLIMDWDGPPGNAGASFYGIKGSNFDARRSAAFRYAISGHQNNARAAVNDCTGGWAEGVPGNDFMITLGGGRDTDGEGNPDQPCWGSAAPNNVDDDGDGTIDEDAYDGIDNDGDCPAGNDANGDGIVCADGDFKVDEDHGVSVGNRAEQAGVLMHELGHLLGLDHGGGDAVNTKPNYLSVMNYAFAVCSVTSIPGALPGGCDYSRDDLDDLVELKDSTNVGLDECKGADGGKYGLGPSNWSGNLTPANLPIFEGATCAAPDQTNVQSDVNGDGAATTLQGYNDWANLVFMFRDRSTYDDGVANPPATDADPLAIERARAFLSRLLAPDVSVDKSGPSETTPGATLSYGLEVRNTGAGPAFSVELADTKPDGSEAEFPLGMLVAGSSASSTVAYAVPCTATDGSVLTNSAAVTAVDFVGLPESSPANNHDQVATTVRAPVLTLAKTATSSVNAGEAVGYRLTYRNTGSGEAKSVLVTDTLPADVYYSAALDQGAGPKPSSVTRNLDGTTTLTWNAGSVAGGSSANTIEYTARPSLLSVAGASVLNGARLTFSNENGCAYAPVTAAQSTAITSVPATRNPLTVGYWKTHPEEWTTEILARIQATDQRFDGADGSLANGVLSASEVTAVLALTGSTPIVLRQQLLATYFNLATRRINAATAIGSRTDVRLGLRNVRDAAVYGIATLALPLKGNAGRYSDAIAALEEINANANKVFVT